MAKRELSSTLKNLKFMQRATQKEEKLKKEEEVKLEGNFVSPSAHNRRCIVIMEGNPHPGALKGRMSFQSFNPAIDVSIKKLNEEAGTLHQSQVPATNSGNQTGRTSDRENGYSQNTSEDSNVARPDNDIDGELKRKQPEVEEDSLHQNKLERNVSSEGDQQSSPSSSKGLYKQHKREKLDWSVLRPPKAQNKRS